MIRTPKEIETRRRIKLAIWAYAYEYTGDTVVDDWTFDVEARQVNLNIRTDRPDLDIWFVINFAPYTGSWIHYHPDLERIKELYEEYFK